MITSGNTPGPQDHHLHQNSLSSFIASHGPGLGSANLMQTPSLNIASPPGKLLTNREAALSTSGLLIGQLSTLLNSYWSILTQCRHSLSCSDLGGAIFTQEETEENESFYNPRPMETPGSIRTKKTSTGWRPGFSPSDFIGSVNQPGSGAEGKLQHAG